MKIFNDYELSPLIGILTARNKKGSLTGNRLLFTKLQKKLISLKGISFIFTIEDVFDDFINGHVFLPAQNKWQQMRFPYPDIVYNRNPFRKLEQQPAYHLLFSKLTEKNIPYFNPCFINKFDLYCLLKDHPTLKPYLPETILANQEMELEAFIDTHKQIYLKPALSARGKGIAFVTSEKAQIKLEMLTSQEIFESFSDFWESWAKNLTDHTYLAQKAISPSVYEGNRFDFRILAHADDDQYVVTGIGIRQSQKQEITTHIPAGGRLLPYEFLKSDEHDQFIQTSVQEIGKNLTQHLGFFGEFSIDAGISQSGQYYIYEVNSKPMSFDEAEIEERKIEQLCRLFFQLANFSK